MNLAQYENIIYMITSCSERNVCLADQERQFPLQLKLLCDWRQNVPFQQ